MRLFFLSFILLSGAASGVGLEAFPQQLVAAAIERTSHDVTYDGAYHTIAYPNGDVPANIGVCTDVIVRSYRALDIDLQTLVHEDMAANFSAYPSRRIWGLANTDKNIDHRRVPNLRRFFSRHGQALPVSSEAGDYAPADIVSWVLPGNLPHIGIVTDRLAADGRTPMIVHNIGSGPQLQDRLFAYRITGHYRYVPAVFYQPYLSENNGID